MNSSQNTQRKKPSTRSRPSLCTVRRHGWCLRWGLIEYYEAEFGVELEQHTFTGPFWKCHGIRYIMGIAVLAMVILL